MGDADAALWTVGPRAVPTSARRCAERRRGERRARAPDAAACAPGHGAPARRRAPGGPRMTQRGPRLGGPGGANRHIRPCGGALGRNGFASARRPGPGIPKRDTNLSKTTPFQRLPYASATRNYQCGSRAGNRPADGQGPDGRANSVDVKETHRCDPTVRAADAEREADVAEMLSTGCGLARQTTR